MPRARALDTGSKTHEWDRNQPSEGYARCINCGMVVRAYKVRKGGLMTCDEYRAKVTRQTKLEDHEEKEHAMCLVGKRFTLSIDICILCDGRIRPARCEQLRHEAGYADLLTAESIQRNQNIENTSIPNFPKQLAL